jgi:hypothetical protein
MTLRLPGFISKMRWKVGLAIYFVGFLTCEVLLLWGAYQTGGFDRSHAFADLAMIGTVHLVAGLLWPVVLVVFILQLAGLLPHPIDF